jgi:hypothetical protein
LVVATHRQRLRVGQGLLELAGEFVLSHEIFPRRSRNPGRRLLACDLGGKPGNSTIPRRSDLTRPDGPLTRADARPLPQAGEVKKAAPKLGEVICPLSRLRERVRVRVLQCARLWLT